MKNIYVCMSGARYHVTTKRIVEDAPKFGVDEVLVYDDVWLRAQTDHCEKSRWLFEHPRVRGINWFAFKPFTVLDALERVAYDDVVLYTDADTFPIADLKVLFDIGRRDGIMLFASSGWPHQRVWCKRACFRMMGQDEPKYHEAPHGCARFMCFTHRHRAFLEEWYYYCLQPRGQTFDIDPNDGPELPGFREHRTEQAIMTNLAHKYGHKLYREACEFGMPPHYRGTEDRELYGQLFTQIYGQSPGDPNSGSRFRNV